MLVCDRFSSLILNYLGQGALLLHEPTAISNPFYRLAPDWALYPLVLLATRVTVIASQAIISGVFSTTQQAMQLGFLPHMQVKHTGHTKVGQIYMPTPNWLLAFMTIAAAVGFGSSEALAGAYGIAVSLLMAITTSFAGILALQWGYSRVPVFVSTGLFLAVDVIFFSANSLKFPQGWPLPPCVPYAFSYADLETRTAAPGTCAGSAPPVRD